MSGITAVDTGYVTCSTAYMYRVEAAGRDIYVVAEDTWGSRCILCLGPEKHKHEHAGTIIKTPRWTRHCFLLFLFLFIFSFAATCCMHAGTPSPPCMPPVPCRASGSFEEERGET